MEILCFAFMIGIPAVIMSVTESIKKRGCGGGCAACGNRRICHKRRKA